MSFKLTYSVNVVLVCMLGLITIVLAQYIPAVVPDKNPTRTFPFVTSLDQEDKFILKWGYDDIQIWFQIQANTLGYVAFGISETGQMVPADIMIGYVNNSVAVLNDYYTDQYYPTMDRHSQSWTLIEGGEKDGWTILTFMRPLEACNTVEDRSITIEADLKNSIDQCMIILCRSPIAAIHGLVTEHIFHHTFMEDPSDKENRKKYCYGRGQITEKASEWLLKNVAPLSHMERHPTHIYTLWRRTIDGLQPNCKLDLLFHERKDCATRYVLSVIYKYIICKMVAKYHNIKFIEANDLCSSKEIVHKPPKRNQSENIF